MSLPAPIAYPSEELQLPDVRRLERMPSWPAWVASRIASLRTEVQPDKTGKWRATSTLPASLILTEGQREQLARHVSDLRALQRQAPVHDAKFEHETLVAVTKMMLVLSSPAQNDVSAEARGEAFMAALDDIPTWAVHSAIRGWYREACGKNAQGHAYDYHWCPAPGELRRIGWAEARRVSARADQLEELLRAEPLIEFSDEHCRKMRERLANLFENLRTSPVGSTAAVERSGVT